LVLSVPDEGYSRNTLYSLKFIPAFLLQWYGQKKKDINTDNDLQNSAQEYNDWEALERQIILASVGARKRSGLNRLSLYGF
jgi:hypothetical protein